MTQKNPIFKRINLKSLLWDGGCILAIICAITFVLLWKISNNEMMESQTKIAKLEQSQKDLKKDLQEKLNKNAALYNQSYEKATIELGSDLQNKDSKIDHLKKDLVDLNQQNIKTQQRLQDPLITSLDIAQDIYAMKWQSNSRVLSDMENHSARTLIVCEKWEELCEKLHPYPELAPQVAKLRIRLAQAYSGMGLINKIDLSKIDWKAAQMETQKPEIEARIWFSIASQLVKLGKLAQAQEYLQKAKSVIPKMKASPEKATYFSAMMNLLDADISASTDPSKSLKFYVQASEDLAKVVTAIPTNTKLRTAFIQACLDGAMLSEGGTSAGQAEKLRKRAYKDINTLLTNHPNIEKPHLLYAEVKILEAEEMLREGQHQKASELLKVARTHIHEGGGSIILTAEADGSQAFIHWDHGERTKAMTIIDEAIDTVIQFREAEPTNTEADYRLASLFWVRSSMQIAPVDSIADGQKSVQHLVKLVQQGAGKREASARRMIAIIYGDIGHQAYSSDQKSVAKKYFEQAKEQWDYLTKNWGQCDEYKEGERWCTWRINSL
jgi:tetratricopeptide (TPR) repeat protein